MTTELSSEQIHEAFDRALKKVAARYEAGELDLSGRYDVDIDAPSTAERESTSAVKPGIAVKPGAAA